MLDRMTFILEMKKLRLREVKQFAQGQATELGPEPTPVISEPLCYGPVSRMTIPVSCSAASGCPVWKGIVIGVMLSELEGILETSPALSLLAHWNQLET